MKLSPVGESLWQRLGRPQKLPSGQQRPDRLPLHPQGAVSASDVGHAEDTMSTNDRSGEAAGLGMPDIVFYRSRRQQICLLCVGVELRSKRLVVPIIETCMACCVLHHRPLGRQYIEISHY